MSPQVFFPTYLGLWAAIAAIAVYFGRAIGVQWWQALVATFLLFFVVNGTMAYRSMKRRLEAEGRQPPPYLTYLFFPRGRQRTSPFQQSIAVPRILLVVVGVPIFLAGVILGVFAVSYGLTGVQAQSLGFVMAMAAIWGTLGVLFVYVGFRLMVVRPNESLFKLPWQKGGG
jgi:hypothetical protein